MDINNDGDVEDDDSEELTEHNPASTAHQSAALEADLPGTVVGPSLVALPFLSYETGGSEKVP